MADGTNTFHPISNSIFWNRRWRFLFSLREVYAAGLRFSIPFRINQYRISIILSTILHFLSNIHIQSLYFFLTSAHSA